MLWVLWPACGSVLLLATTNKLCLDVAVFPLLWILPLSVYLLSFVVCFDNPRWYRPAPYAVALGLVLLLLCWALFKGATWPFANQVFIYCSGLLVCCLVCHGELFRLRPGTTQLTKFYLLIAAGGAFGGLFVSLLAPMIFSSYCELNWGLGILSLLVTARWIFPAQSQQLEGARASGNSTTVAPWRSLGTTLICLASAGIISTLWLQARWSNPDIVHRSRNFYGVLTVFEHRKDEPRGHHYLLQHGRITHGLQLVDLQLQTLPTTYYGAESGIGLALRALSTQARHIGVVGLGAGTLAAYGRSRDSFSFYEINPEVNRVASETFKYLARSAASCEVILGDARLNLERQPRQDFDLLALDAFSSDAIPVHLLTKEAFQIYLHHLKTNGILAVHISNHFLDLQQVVLGLAREFGLKAAVIDHDADPQQWWIYSSTWVLLSRDEQFLALPSISTVAKPVSYNRALPLWTDDFSSLFQILK